MLSDDQFVSEVSANLPRLRGLCRAYCRELTDREDLLQDILATAWRHRGSFRQEASFSTWLYRVAVNVALQRLRRLRRVPVEEPLDAVPEPPSSATSTSAEEVMDAALAAAIDTLPLVDRTVVALHLAQRSHAEIAGVIGVSANAIAIRLSRIRERLRDRLTRRADEPE